MSLQEELGKHCVRLRLVLRRSLTPSQEVSHRRRQCWSNNLLFVMRKTGKKTRLFSLLLHISSPCEAWLVPKPSVPAPWCVCVSVSMYVLCTQQPFFFFYPQSYQSVHLIQSLNLPLFLHTRTHTHSLFIYVLPPSLPASLSSSSSSSPPHAPLAHGYMIEKNVFTKLTLSQIKPHR